jgi:hypothetical protein
MIAGITASQAQFTIPTPYVEGLTVSTDETGGIVDISSLRLQEGDMVIVAWWVLYGTGTGVSIVRPAGWNELSSTLRTDIFRTNMVLFLNVMGAVPETSIDFGLADPNVEYIVSVQAYRGVSKADIVVGSQAGSHEPNPGAISDVSGTTVAIMGGGVSSVGGTGYENTGLANFTTAYRAGLAGGSPYRALGGGGNFVVPALPDPPQWGTIGAGNSGNDSTVWLVSPMRKITSASAASHLTISGVYSSSLFASKGQILRAGSNMTIESVDAFLGSSGETYKLVVVRNVANTNTIGEILGESASQVTAGTAEYTFTLPSPVSVGQGERIGFILVRTDGTATSPARPQFPGVAGTSNTDWTDLAAIRYASIDPLVGDAIGYGAAGAVGLTINYSIYY